MKVLVEGCGRGFMEAVFGRKRILFVDDAVGFSGRWGRGYGGCGRRRKCFSISTLIP